MKSLGSSDAKTTSTTGSSSSESASSVNGTLFPKWNPNASFIDNINNIIDHIWDFNFKIGDTQIFFHQLLIALVVFILGFFVSRLISYRVGKKVLPRMKVQEGPAFAIQTILFYILLLITAIISLQIARVPLTVFTIFGGALALGIGFGSQNIMNNFISGLILMLERPISVNEFITVNNESGKVIKIGARATQIQRYDGVAVVIPNSQLLENPVANWNLPDPRIRMILPIGVAYGTDVKLVKSLLESLLDDSIRVVQSPENRVLYVGFGDSSLNFEVQFWISPRSKFDRRQIQSDMYFKIDELFRENNITVPFPQRDVHFFNETRSPAPSVPDPDQQEK